MGKDLSLLKKMSKRSKLQIQSLRNIKSGHTRPRPKPHDLGSYEDNSDTFRGMLREYSKHPANTKMYKYSEQVMGKKRVGY